MSSDFYGQGGRDQHVRRWILTRLDESDDHFQPSQSGTSGSPSWPEQGYLSQDSPLSYQDMSQHHDGQVQQHLQAKSNQTLQEEDKVALAYSHQAAFSIPQGHRSSLSSTGLDGQSLYCTEVQSVSPPSQPVTVEGGGTSRRSLVAVNGGARSHPVQYTIIITDPQLQQTSAGNNTSTAGATSILLNTLVQQQQHQHLQLQQQQQQQVQLATISEANSGLITGATNANLLVNNNNTNGSSKFGNLLICNNNNSNLSSDGGLATSTSTFPSITSHHNNSFSDGKGIHFTKLTLSANTNLPPTLIDRGSIEGGIVILNYSEPQQRTGSATIHNINQLVSVQSKVASGSDLVTQGNTHHLLKPVSEASAAVSGYSNRSVTSNIKVNVCDHSELHQVDFRARVSAAGCVPYNGQGFVDKEDSGDLQSSQNSISHITQVLPFSGELESTSSSNRVSGGMHSGRTGSGSGQAHSSHQQQQQQHNPVSSSSSFTTTASTSSQSAMLSAGQPAVPSGIFRTGTDNTASSQRLSASASSSYVSPQYPPIYGIHSQATGHLTTLQPYSTFFPGYGASTTPGHTFSHGAVMAGTSQNHYPHIESYSAMLASMGSHAQHRGVQGTDRTLRVQAPVVSVTQHTGPFLSSSVQMAAQGVQQYPTPSSHRRPSGSGSPSPGPATPTHTPPSASAHLDAHHLEKMASIKGSSSLQGREGEVSRELRLYGDSFNLLEDKPRLSPSSTYSSSSHIPKVSFDTVVKEYGGGRDSPTGRCDLYFRASLSGKEGSLKHRILTRPSDSEAVDDLSRVSGVHGLKDEPLAKRQKMTNVGSAAVAYGAQASHGHHGDNQRAGNRYHAVPHTTSHHSQPTISNTLDSRGAGVRHHPDSNLPGHDSQQPSPYHHHTDDSNTDIRYQPPHYQSSPASSSPSLSPTSECPPSHLQYPSHFMKGSIIQLANGTLKRVEDLQTEDFVNSAEISSDLKVDSSTVIRIEEQPERGTAMLSFSVGEHQVQDSGGEQDIVKTTSKRQKTMNVTFRPRPSSDETNNTKRRYEKYMKNFWSKPNQVTVEATLEHPFFVFGQGWSSCSVSRTLARYGLDCLKLNVGDVCISLTHKDVHLKAAEIGQLQQDQRYLTEPQNKLTTTVTTGLVSVEHQITSPQSTSSSTLPFSTTISSSSSVPSKALLSSMKSENTDTSFLPPLPTASTSTSKRRLSQTELPPPLSNIVLVKKENNGHNSRRRSSQRVEDELHEEKVFEEEDESDSTLSLRKRRWSAPDPGSVKAEQEREKDRQISGGQSTEETQQTSSADNGRQ